MKLLGYVWKTSATCSFCIILIENDIEKVKKSYIQIVIGVDQEIDLLATYHLGAKFPVKAAELAIKEDGTMCNKDWDPT